MGRYDRFKDIKKKNEATKKAAKVLGHVAKYVGAGYMCDQYICSCGWQSNKFWDGAEFAEDEWIKHAEKALETGQANLDLG